MRAGLASGSTSDRMATPDQAVASPRSGWRLRAASLVAPVLLVLVASVQFVVAQSGELSPWKGGGFGMFSTVDSPDARFLRIYLVDDGERIPVLLPARAEGEWLRGRTFPTDDRLRRIAQIVAGGTWIPYEFSRVEDRYELLADEPANGHHGGAAAPSPPPATHGSLEDLGLYRMVTEDEVEPAAEDVVSFEAVRVELWRYGFAPSPPALEATRATVISLPAAPR